MTRGFTFFPCVYYEPSSPSLSRERVQRDASHLEFSAHLTIDLSPMRQLEQTALSLLVINIESPLRG